MRSAKDIFNGIEVGLDSNMTRLEHASMKLGISSSSRSESLTYLMSSHMLFSKAIVIDCARHDLQQSTAACSQELVGGLSGNNIGDFSSMHT